MASEKILRELHDLLVSDLIAKIRSGTATASELGVARQLLKDNNIDSSPRKDSPIMKLYETLPFSPADDEVIS
jgi:hypothetical protein